MNYDDPKLTTYALGELDESDRAEVEAFIARDEAARRFVEETRQTVALLSQGLQSVELPSLTDSQREAIRTAATDGPRRLDYATPAGRSRRIWARWALATAACAAIASATFFGRSMQKARMQQVAVNSVAPSSQPQNPTDYWGEAADGKGWDRQRLYMKQLSANTRPMVPADGERYSWAAPQPPQQPLDALQQHAASLGGGNGGGQLGRTGGGRGGMVRSYTRGLNDGLGTGAALNKEYKVPAQAGGQPRPEYDFGSAASTFSLSQPAPTAVVGGKANAPVARFDTQLQTAREALARKDVDGARAALVEARKSVSEVSGDTLSDQERKQALLALRQVEAGVPGTESYAAIGDNPFTAVVDQPLSTFSIDVDTASYSNVRRFINQGQLPPPDAVRIEEMLNYFPYQYETPKPDDKEPFKAAVEVAGCPWNSAHRLARVAIKGKEIAHDKRPVSNLVFLIDVSGSMNEPRKLPLVKEGLKLLVNELTENDRISIVVYAGNAGLVLPSTCADPKSKDTILAAIDNLSAGGSTNGGQGIELAYHLATDNFIKGGTNRVLLATDGDWNVGITDQTSLTHLIEDKAKSGVFLSVLGFGFGNLKDSTMEKLADKGNGHYAYIDDLKEARKVLVEEMSGTLVTIAKDVKIQIEFNPAKVASYRLIGYENRMLRKEDFNNDKIDAGEIGAGHCVTALYEIAPATGQTKAPTTRPAASPEIDPLKYQKHELINSPELLTLKLRYKQPDGDTSKLIQTAVTDGGLSYGKASVDFKFAAAVAEYGMILRNSPNKGSASLDAVLELADEGKGKDEKGYRAGFVELARKTKALVK